MNSLTSVETFPEIQPPVENDGETLAGVSQPRFQLPNLRRLPDEPLTTTRADASQETRFQLVFQLTLSQIMLAQWVMIEQELWQSVNWKTS